MSRRSTLIGIGVVIVGAATAVIIFLISSSVSQDSDGQISEIVPTIEDFEGGTKPPPLPTLVIAVETEPAFVQNTVTIENSTPTEEQTETYAETSTISEASSQPPVSPSPTTITNHQVVEGENLYRIAAIYGVSLESIMIANELEDPRYITTGQTLIITGHSALTLTADNGEVIPTTAPAATENSSLTVEISATSTAAPLEGTEEPAPTAAATLSKQGTATSPPQPASSLNGIAIEQIVVMPEDVKQHAREIFAAGQLLGRNPRSFSKVGDSTIENPHFLARFDEGSYNLGIYSYLQPTIDYFAGSMSREGNAVKRGLHSWTVMDPLWADDEICEPNETPIACEIRLHNPSILLIRLGSNDRGVPAGFDQNVRQLVDYAITEGILPVIGTKADRFEGEDNINNILLRQIASDYKLPLWDFDLVAGTISGRGLYEEDVHLTIYYAHDYTSPVALQRGHGVHNLTALMVLDAIRSDVIEAGN